MKTKLTEAEQKINDNVRGTEAEIGRIESQIKALDRRRADLDKRIAAEQNTCPRRGMTPQPKDCPVCEGDHR